MHIAICDDNIADRKHLERLLSRESDKRNGSSNILYVDSFGDKDRLLQSPLLYSYDLMFVDLTSGPNVAEDLVLALRNVNIDCTIIMYSSTIDYSVNGNLQENIVHMKKPYIPDPLPELLSYGDLHVTGVMETIEVHSDGNHVQIPVKDIYSFYSCNHRQVVSLSEGKVIELDETSGEIQMIIEKYPEFTRLTKSVIVNLRYTALITPICVIMQDYHEFYYLPFIYKDLLLQKEKVDSMFE